MKSDMSREAWARIRADYEHTDRPILDICAEHGFSDRTLYNRARRWGWRRRREPVPGEGPPPAPPPDPPAHSPSKTGVNALTPEEGFSGGLPAPAIEWADVIDIAAPALAEKAPTLPSPASGGGIRKEASGGGIEGEWDAAPLPAADAGAIVPRLQNAVARIIAAIEAAVARLAAGPTHPRELERGARALSSLMRTLRELKALLAEQQAAAAARAVNDDPIPRDIDEFRRELARRMDAFVVERTGKSIEEIHREIAERGERERS